MEIKIWRIATEDEIAQGLDSEENPGMIIQLIEEYEEPQKPKPFE